MSSAGGIEADGGSLSDGNSAGQMYSDVEHIAAHGVLGEFKYDVSFGASEDGRMRVIYAPNGRGKTNFLRAVSLLLSPSPDALQELIEVPIKALSISFRSGASIEIERESAFAGSYKAIARSESTGQEGAGVDVEPADFAGRYYKRVWHQRDDYTRFVNLVNRISHGSILIGDDRLAADSDRGDVDRPDSIVRGNRRKSTGVVTRLLEQVERMLTQSAFDSLSRENYATAVYLEITRTTLHGSKKLTTSEARSQLESRISRILDEGSGLEKYGLISLRQVREISEELSTTRVNSSKLPSLHPILQPFLDSLQEQITTLTPAQQLIDTFVTAVNHFLDRKELRFSASKGVQLYGKDESRLDPENLSSGERHLLYLLSQAILATNERRLVIVDEPELSLGLEWQRDLLSELLRCSVSSGVQFLVASHSVQIMGRLSDDDISQPSEG